MKKKHARAYQALKEVARREGIPIKQVIDGIDQAIFAAYTNALACEDQETLAAWSQIPCKGSLPTALELVVYLSDRVAGEVHMGSMEDSKLS